MSGYKISEAARATGFTGQRIDGVRLIAGRGGVFAIRVDDEQICDKRRASISAK